MTSRRLGALGALGIGAALSATLPSKDLGAQAPAAPTCEGWQVDYTLAASLELSGTPLGQGDGIYPVGPGTIVLRFDDIDGQPGGRAKVMSYEMHEAFKVVSKTLFWATTVTSDNTTRASPEACGPAEGSVAGTTLGWTRALASVRTDGTLFCSGSFCGKFGAPPPGQSMFAIPPHPVAFKSFQFSADKKTFAMASTFVSKTDMPKQTAHIAISGRELRRTCVPKRGCP